MRPDVIVLNGGSSSGTSQLARALQEILPDPWLTFGVDTLIDGMPPGRLIRFGDAGEVNVLPGFRDAATAWRTGIAAIAAAGTGVIVDEVFLGGGEEQALWHESLEGLQVLWVGVRCDPEVAAARERARGDRVEGMAASQAELVHKGVTYDVDVDTSHTSAADCARDVVAAMSRTRNGS